MLARYLSNEIACAFTKCFKGEVSEKGSGLEEVDATVAAECDPKRSPSSRQSGIKQKQGGSRKKNLT